MITLALREASILTGIVTIILDNQSLIKNIKSLTPSLTSLLEKQRAYKILMYPKTLLPRLTGHDQVEPRPHRIKR